MDAFIEARHAINESITRDTRAVLALPEDISGLSDREDAALEQLEEFGLDGHSRENNGSIDAWGTLDDGGEWRLLLVDGLTTSVRYV